MKIKLSAVRMVKTSHLKVNKKNAKYFKFQNEKQLESLILDIAKRGILVPLIAKKDGMLLAGHCRLKAAKKLNLKTVPVQFVIESLSDQEENQFLIKDNALRRHMGRNARKIIYYQMYPDFDIRLHRSGKTNGIDLRKLSEETGLNYNTIAGDLTSFRKHMKAEGQKKSEATFNEKAIDTFQKNMARLLNTAMIETTATLDKMIECTQTTLDRLNAIKELHKAKTGDLIQTPSIRSLLKHRDTA